jgi:hypothetical protein
MTEEQWLGSAANPEWMVNVVGRGSPRKLRLFAVACCRRILPRVGDDHKNEIEELVAAAERFADGIAPTPGLPALHRESIPWDDENRAAIEACNPDPLWAARHAARFAGWVVWRHLPRKSEDARTAKRHELSAQVALMRCIFGNPFRPGTLAPLRLPEAVVSMARAIYEDGSFAELPILADVLEEARSGELDLLSHCRAGTDHVRGCWVIDSILGKS